MLVINGANVFVFVVFTSAHHCHGNVWLLPVKSLYSYLTLYHGLELAYPYDWRGFVEAKKKTRMSLLVFYFSVPFTHCKKAMFKIETQQIHHA